MQGVFRKVALTTAVAVCFGFAAAASAVPENHGGHNEDPIELGPRPFYLVEGMDSGPLKDKLMQCENGPFKRTDFSIGHRGAALQFPEHTKEAYQAGARMGAGIVECDVTFTKNGDLVCRHAENDLHFTTNILQTPLASTCITPFTPATLDANGDVVTPATAECRTSALSLDEFKSLRGKMEAFNPAAQTADEFVGGTPSFRTDLYTGRGTLMSLRDSIRLNEKNGVKHTPELKAGDADTIKAIFGSQEAYAQKFADVLQEEGVRPEDAFPQSFNVNDILYWIKNTKYGKQAVFLVDYDDVTNNILLFDTTGKQLVDKADQLKFFQELRKAKVNIVAPAMPALLALDGSAIVPSQLAKDLRGMGFDIITWTFERADLRQGASKAGFYFDFDPNGVAVKKDSDMYKALDVLARDVKILGIFSDWAATVTYYANCMNLK
jgi:glycerophosphoryl diester phosphodiesterase